MLENLFWDDVTAWFDKLGARIKKTTIGVTGKLVKAFHKLDDIGLNAQKKVRGDVVKAAVGAANVLGDEAHVNKMVEAG